MRSAALLALALSASPHLTQDDLAALAHALPPFTGTLASLGPALDAARTHGASPSVAAVRDHLASLRTLEEKARLAQAQPLHSAELAGLHLSLALAWAEVGDLESALVIQGEGDGPQRDAVRTQAQARSDDAGIIAASELFEAVSVLGAGLPERIHALGLRFGAGLKQGTAAREVAASRSAELQACWEEHLLTQGSEEPLAVMATLDLDAGRVVGVSFIPALDKQRARLGACLTTRLMGWQVTDDADALELPLRLGAASGRE